jgi:transcriptional regulator with XRE-family HTH domain
MSLFSKNLRFLRKKSSLNQEEISLLFNKRANTIGNWENQKSEPSLTELIKLGEYFKVSVQELLHTDLELQYSQREPSTIIDMPLKSSKPYPLQEPLISSANENSQDAFWIILKELRTVNEKLDLLASRPAFSSPRTSSDKSAH